MAHDGRALQRGVRLRTGAARALGRARLATLAAASERPAVVLGALLGANAAAAALFASAGVAAGDPALFFREGMPGTWLSFAQLALVAVVAWMVHEYEHPEGAWHRNFWGLSAAVFGVLAVDEILGTSQWAGTWLNQAAGVAPAGAFRDVGAVLLTLLLAAAVLVLAPRALALLRHPLAAVLVALGAVVGAGSQALDSFVAPTAGEFVAEESLKLAAEAFILAGFVAALRSARARSRPTAPPGGAGAPRDARAAS